jgi:hypothetical protein
MCDVCGRTLLRGERADVYLNGGTRRSVCELCKSRAVHEGWVREGTVPAYESGETGSERRRSLLGRLRSRSRDDDGAEIAPTLADDLDAAAWSQAGEGINLEPLDPLPPSDPARRRRREPRREPVRPARAPRPVREPRHVRAVPSSSDHKIAAAADLFNGSEHRRTVSGVARSLGEPSVTITPVPDRPSLVNVVVSWELCWYRYEVDLSEDEPAVRVSSQGYELEELDPTERVPNAVASESGVLSLPAQP